ncbi:MAG: hypothetical protein OXI43_10295 [Candidatus Poribacteria bacterium]|nr:hypothetical protein [Candidatus Poribacteria bacterium]
MNLKAAVILLFLFTTVTFIGCYTKLGYYEPASLKEKHDKHVEKNTEKMEHASDSDAETEGYYGRRKRSYSSSYPYASRSYWTPYVPYTYYPPAYYYPYPWHYGYGYYTPYYRYYRGYYPYRSYYGRYHGSTFYPASRGTYKRGAVLREYRSENRRSRASRSVSSANPRSERPQRKARDSNEN